MAAIFCRFFPLLMLCFGTTMYAQDPQFTQNYAAPLSVNPAMAGTYGGSFRISTVYRDQWRSALDNPLKTFTASGDVKFDAGFSKKTNPDQFALGLTFTSDRISLFEVNTNAIMINGAFHKSLSKKRKEYLGIGFQGGVWQRSVNYDHLTFQDQFNAIDGYTLSTSEFLPPNNLTVMDLHVGLYYALQVSKKLSWHTGFAAQHINRPNLSFYNDESILNKDIQKINQFYPRYTWHGGVAYSLNYKTEIHPRAVVMAQGESLSLQMGANLRLKVTERTGQYLHIGPWIRSVKNQSSFGFESFSVMTGLERNNFIIGFSYDSPLTYLIRDGQQYGSFEISLTYIGNYDNDDHFCPQF